jgi:hypothetical protein
MPDLDACASSYQDVQERPVTLPVARTPRDSNAWHEQVEEDPVKGDGGRHSSYGPRAC